MPAPRHPRIFLSAGEASGEHYGARLIHSIRARSPHADCFGLGGPAMEAQGFRPIVRSEDVAHMGITEVLRHAPSIYSSFQRLKASIRRERPDVAILIDFPDVNLRLAEALHKQGVPVIYFVSPQLWAWKKRRIERVRKYVTRMLVIFPFEVPFYQSHNVPADFVGHPLAELPPPSISRARYAAAHHLDPAKPWIALLPGSRRRQITLNLPAMLDAADFLTAESQGGYEFIVPVAPGIDPAFLAPLISRPGLPTHLVTDARAALHHARASIVSSGTATVDAALSGNPFVVVYRLSPLSYAIAKRVVTVPHVAMVNLIANQRLVPELIQSDFTSPNILAALRPLLADGPARSTMQTRLRHVQAALTSPSPSTSIDSVASIALSYTQNSATPGRPVSVS